MSLCQPLAYSCSVFSSLQPPPPLLLSFVIILLLPLPFVVVVVVDVDYLSYISFAFPLLHQHLLLTSNLL